MADPAAPDPLDLDSSEVGDRSQNPPPITERLGDSSATTEGASLLEALLLEYVQRTEAGEADVLEDICRRNPEQAEGFRRVAAHIDDMRGGPEATQRLGRFELRGTLGVGGMGAVYEAYDPQLGRVVAIKVLQAGLGSPSMEARFDQEIQTVAKLQHPGVVPIFEVGRQGETRFFVMERLFGATLHEVIRASDSSAEFPAGLGELLDRGHVKVFAQAAARLVRDVALAVDYVHRRGVIHRDIKPSNIIIREGGQPVLLDFGIARIEEDLALTRSGDLVGTPHYASPEQISGSRERIDSATDVYSMGVVLYELLCGQRPFDGDNTGRLLQQILTREPQALHTRVPGLSKDLASIARQAMEKRPAQRYLSARELADDLDRFLRGKPVQARPASGLRVLPRQLRRRLLQPWVWVGISFLLVLGTVYSTSYSAARAQRDRSEWIASVRAQAQSSLALGEELLEQLARVPGGAERSVSTLQLLSQHAQQLAEVSSSDPELLLLQAQVLRQLAELRTRVEPGLDLEADLDRARAIVAGLAAETASSSVILERARIEVAHGRLLAVLDHEDQADEHLGAGIALCAAARAGETPSPEWLALELRARSYLLSCRIDGQGFLPPEFVEANAAALRLAEQENVDEVLREEFQLNSELARGIWELDREQGDRAEAHFERATSHAHNVAEVTDHPIDRLGYLNAKSYWVESRYLTDPESAQAFVDEVALAVEQDTGWSDGHTLLNKARWMRGLAWVAAGREAEGQEELDQLMRETPETWADEALLYRMLVTRGMLANRNRNPELAVRVLTRATEGYEEILGSRLSYSHTRNAALAYRFLANALWERGLDPEVEFERAVQLYERCQLYAPSDPLTQLQPLRTLTDQLNTSLRREQINARDYARLDYPADVLFSTAVALVEEAADDPREVVFRSCVTAGYSVAVQRSRSGDWAGSREALEATLGWTRQYPAQDLSDHLQVALIESELAMAQQALGEAASQPLTPSLLSEYTEEFHAEPSDSAGVTVAELWLERGRWLRATGALEQANEAIHAGIDILLFLQEQGFVRGDEVLLFEAYLEALETGIVLDAEDWLLEDAWEQILARLDRNPVRFLMAALAIEPLGNREPWAGRIREILIFVKASRPDSWRSLSPQGRTIPAAWERR